MIRRPIPPWLFITLGFLGIFVACGLYEALSFRQTAKNPHQTVVPGVRALSAGVGMILKPRGTATNPKPSWLWEDLRATYWRLFLGLAAGVALSLVVGMLVGAYTPVDALINPLITFFAKVPPTAMLAVYMILFGTELTAYVALVGLGVFFSMVQAISSAVKTDVAHDHIDKAYTLGASEAEVIFEVIWKQILPRVIDNER